MGVTGHQGGLSRAVRIRTSPSAVRVRQRQGEHQRWTCRSACTSPGAGKAAAACLANQSTISPTRAVARPSVAESGTARRAPPSIEGIVHSPEEIDHLVSGCSESSADALKNFTIIGIACTTPTHRHRRDRFEGVEPDRPTNRRATVRSVGTPSTKSLVRQSPPYGNQSAAEASTSMAARDRAI